VAREEEWPEKEMRWRKKCAGERNALSKRCAGVKDMLE
jgi:hypothetical protein